MATSREIENSLEGQPRRTWPVLVVALITLILLAAVSGVSTFERARTLNATVWELKRSHQRNDRLLQTVRSEVQLSGLALRDYLLDPSTERSGLYRDQLRQHRQTVVAALAELSGTSLREHAQAVAQLRDEVERYWAAIAPVFDWDPNEKRARSFDFLRHNVLPRRQAVLDLTTDIEKLAQLNLQTQEEQLAKAMSDFERFLLRVTVAALVVSSCVAFAAGWRVSVLERLATNQYRATLFAEGELRRLSNQLVSAQEEERRALSRELHDEVGQMLTGLRMDLTAVQKLHSAPREHFDVRLDQTRVLLDQTLVAVRDMATGLRPSLLDDLGLEPALNWQAREFSRRYDLPVSVKIEADLRQLTDLQRTAIFRVVQEALTNCARHANARSLEIRLKGRTDGLQLTIEDDGVGPAGITGLGVLGMQERIRSLGGRLELQARQPSGTIVRADIPHNGTAAYA